MLRSARVALCLVPALLAVASVAHADDPPPLPDPSASPPPGYGQPPPPGYGQPPPAGYGQPPPAGYGQPPPGYYPPPGYGQPYYAPPQAQDPRPLVMDYDDDQPIPEGYHLRTRARRGLVGAGAGVLGGFWFLSAITGLIGDAANRQGDGGWAALYVPIAGPFIAMSTLNADSAGAALLALDGIAQLGGGTMLVLGLALRQKQLVRDVAFSPLPGLTVTPTFTGTGAGFVGSF